MDGNPEGTPNPLNPVQGEASVESGPQPSTDMAAGTGTLDYAEPEEVPINNINSNDEPTTATHSAVDPLTRPISRATTGPEPMRTESSFDGLAPNDNAGQISNAPELVAKDSVVEPASGKGGKKKALIICAIAFIIVAIICGATAIAMAVLNNKGGDRVGRAIEKLINGEAPTIVEAKGTISSSNETDYDEFVVSNPLLTTAMDIDFDGTFDLVSSTNKVQADLTLSYANGGKVTLNINELRDDEGDTFFKISGLDGLINAFSGDFSTDDSTFYADLEGDSTAVTDSTTDCTKDGTEKCTTIVTTNCADGTELNCVPESESSLDGILSIYSGLIEAVDDQWIMASGDFTETMDSMSLFDNTSTCLIEAFDTLPKYSKDIASKYKANAFITYSTDNLEISKRKNDLYKLSFDSEKMGAFVNSLNGNGFINELNACSGNVATNAETSSNLLEEIFNNFPTVYAEVDENDNFTRFYFATKTEVEGVSSSIRADIDLSYPSEIKVTDPDDYIDMSTLLSTVMGNLLKDTTE